MLEQFVYALPGSLAPILLTAVIAAVCKPYDVRLHRTSRFARLAGVIVGVIAAIIFATVRASGILSERTVINLPTLWLCVICDVLAAGIFLALTVSKKLRDTSSARLIDVINGIFAVTLALTFFRALPDVILRVTSFVETGQTFFTSDMLLRALGFALGIAASVVIALIFASMISSVPMRVFAATGVVLMMLIFLQHWVDLTQILFSTRAIVMTREAFKVLVWGLNNTLTIVIAQACVFVIPMIASIIIGMRTKLEGETIAVVRSHRAFKRRSFIVAAAALFAIICVGYTLTYGVAATKVEIVLSAPEKYTIENGVASIPVDQVSDGHLHRFEYDAKDGTSMRFLAIKKGAGSVVVVLDACENCGDAGYYEKDGKIICKKCDVAMNVATIGFKGGCNPIPIEFDNDGKTVTVKTAVLDAQSKVFRR